VRVLLGGLAGALASRSDVGHAKISLSGRPQAPRSGAVGCQPEIFGKALNHKALLSTLASRGGEARAGAGS
jgi:hypothetical protein